VPRRRRPSEYSVQLREKQKTRWTYGVLERQFRKYFDMAREQDGITGDNLISILETRLDNVVYRLSFAESRRQARQLVNHGHFHVNGGRMDIPSYLVKAGDTVTWKRVNGSTPEFIAALTQDIPKRPVPAWLQLDTASLSGQVVAIPDATSADTGIEVRLIVELYSK
jgi:small subunit ribosomal protein S4